MLCPPTTYSGHVELGGFISQSWNDCREIQKRVMYMHSCYFAYLNLLLFRHSCCCHHRHCLTSPLLWSRNFADIHLSTILHVYPYIQGWLFCLHQIKHVFYICTWYHNAELHGKKHCEHHNNAWQNCCIYQTCLDTQYPTENTAKNNCYMSLV